MNMLVRGLLAGCWLLFAAAALADDEQAAPDQGQKDQGAGELFDRLDANKDGQLTADEVPEEHQRLFGRLQKSADQDKNGQISREEFAVGLKDSRPPRNENQPAGQPGEGGPAANFNPEAMFKQLDTNGDGQVTLEEVPEERRERFKRGIGKADKNGDGAVTIEEFRAGMKALVGGQQPGNTKNRPNVPPDGLIVAALDRNKDGTLDKEEIASAVESLKSLDKDGDGALSRQELRPEPPPGQAKPGKPQPGQPQPGGQVAGDEIRRRFKEADGDGDGKLSREEAPEQLKGHFDQVDTNQDGFVDSVEIDQMLAGGGKGRPEGGAGDFLARLMQADKDGDGKLSKDEVPPAIQQHFDAVDTDQDGLIDGAELKQAGQKLAELFRGQFGERLKQADKDGDGKLSREEAPEPLKQRFDQVDKNQDGFVDEQELKQLGGPGQPKPPKPEGEQQEPKPEGDGQQPEPKPE